jgi:hypothetical protein
MDLRGRARSLYRVAVHRLGLVAALLLSMPLLAITPREAAAADANIHAVYVKVGLIWEGSTFRHPGFLMAADEQGVFEIEAGGKKHAIIVSFVELGEKQLTLRVEYEINGSTQWIENIDVEAGADTTVSKGRAKLILNADPQGSEDTSREDQDKLEKPGHDPDDPLGGA